MPDTRLRQPFHCHPTFLNHQNPGDLILGRQRRFPISRLVRVTAIARTARMYVIGMSGKGKSKLLEWCLHQDIAAGRGCGLIDPHSFLVDDLLQLLITQGDRRRAQAPAA
jgi:hypothetical protein